MELRHSGGRTAARRILERFGARILQLAVAAVFLTAGINKSFDYGTVVHTLFRLKWLPGIFIYPTASLLILLELGTGCLLLTGRAVKAAAGAGTLMSACFTVVTVAIVQQHGSTPCGCFGRLLALPATGMLTVDLLLLLSCLALLGLLPRRTAREMRGHDYTR